MLDVYLYNAPCLTITCTMLGVKTIEYPFPSHTSKGSLGNPHI